MTLEAKIAKLCEKRARLWKDGRHPAEVAEVTVKLDEAYSELRARRARGEHGSPQLIAKRARVEQELEKLMARA